MLVLLLLILMLFAGIYKLIAIYFIKINLDLPSLKDGSIDFKFMKKYILIHEILAINSIVAHYKNE